MHVDGVLPFYSPLTDYLRFQLLGSEPINTALVNGDELVQPKIDASFLHNHLSVLQHLSPYSTTAPPTASPVAIQGMSAVELTVLIEALHDCHTGPAPSPSS